MLAVHLGFCAKIHGLVIQLIFYYKVVKIYNPAL